MVARGFANERQQDDIVADRLPRSRRARCWRASSHYGLVSGVREFDRLNAAVQAARLKVPIAESYSIDRAYTAHERPAQAAAARKDRPRSACFIAAAIHIGTPAPAMSWRPCSDSISIGT
jgi:hypothetical protein